MWPADFRHGDDVWREKKSFLFFDGCASSSLTGNTSKRNYYYIHTYSLLYSITCLPYLVVTALQSNFIVRISDSKKTHNNCQHKAPRATLQQGPATQNSTQSTAETYQFIPLPLHCAYILNHFARWYYASFGEIIHQDQVSTS